MTWKFSLLYSYYLFFRKYIPLKPQSAYFESHASSDLAGNLYRIAEELLSKKYGNFTIYISIIGSKLPNNIRLLKKNHPEANIILVQRGSIKHYYTLATSKYLFTDVSIITPYIKREGQIITQTWHGTPLKKLGFDFISDVTWTTDQKRAFSIADYCLFPNCFTMERLVESYRLKNTMNGTILLSGYPRNSVFYDNNIASKMRQLLQIENQKIYVYMPTWRGNLRTRSSIEQQSNFYHKLLTQIDSLLTDNQILYAKLHRLDNADIDYSLFKHIREFPNEFECYEFLTVADCLITDYSSVMFDFLNTRKKIILFTYDKHQYLSKQGTYFDIDKLPFPQVQTINELIIQLNTPKGYDDSSVLEYFCSYDSLDASEKLCCHIISNKKRCQEISPFCNKHTNTLYYLENFRPKWITTNFIYFLDTLKPDQENYFISFLSEDLKTNPEYLQCVSKEFNLIGIDSYNGSSYYTTFLEKIIYALFNRNINHPFIIKKLEQLFQREFDRQYFNLKFDKLVRFGGTDIDSLRLFMFSNVVTKVLIEYDEIKEHPNSDFQRLLKVMEQQSRVIYLDKNSVTDNFAI